MGEFEKGMVVQLKSGGPKMTVVDINPKFEASIVCEYFSGTERKRECFYPESLQIAKEKKGKIYTP
ncbi:MAG: YodC family protein [Candidatus Hodarchaeales archaeon]